MQEWGDLSYKEFCVTPATKDYSRGRLMVQACLPKKEENTPFCVSYDRRFGHKSCLFFGKLDKFLWLYGPILIMLLINTGMFIYITINVVKNQ